MVLGQTLGFVTGGRCEVRRLRPKYRAEGRRGTEFLKRNTDVVWGTSHGCGATGASSLVSLSQLKGYKTQAGQDASFRLVSRIA